MYEVALLKLHGMNYEFRVYITWKVEFADKGSFYNYVDRILPFWPPPYCINSCHIHNFVSVCNLRFPKNSKGILIEFPKSSQKFPQKIPNENPPTIHPKKCHNNFQEISIEFPQNSKRISKEFPNNSQKFPENSQKIPRKFWLALIGRNPFWACFKLRRLELVSKELNH